MKVNTLKLRRILSVVCYILMLAADFAEVYVIYFSYSGGITYYFGMLLFVPIFIFTYWMETFFSQLTYGKVKINSEKKKKRIMPKKLRAFLNSLGTILSLAIVAFWIYIYIMQSLNTTSNEALLVKNFLL
ncbi:MAG: hypothetical protein LUE12_09195 [Ruminococcus sp.]|nr:hypothetical protein [Ruminococcus sp.]